jgi:hypothetical protein
MEVLQMLYSVIFKGLTDEDIQAIGQRINPPVLAKIGARLDAQETREAINSLAKVHIETLIIDMDSVDEALLIEAMNAYRVQRPETRIIIYARGRQPGDLALDTLRGMSIHDLLAPDEPPADLADFIIKALDSPPADYAGSARWGISRQSPVAPRKSRPGINIKLEWPGRKAVGQGVRYMPHMLVAVWSPSGFAKSFTAVNLAATAASKGFDAALVNYDFQCPELDAYFGVKQSGLNAQGCMGVMTFGEDMRPELVDRFIVERWGIKYLPAGSKLGRIVTPDIEPAKLDLVLRNIYNRNAAGRPVITIVDAGRRYEYAPTLVALRQAGVILVPSDGSLPASTVAKDQIGELYRLGHCPRFVELFLDAGKKPHSICRERLSVRFDYHEYVTATKPVAPGREDWEAVLNRLAPGSQEMDAQSFDDEDGGSFVSSKPAQY